MLRTDLIPDGTDPTIADVAAVAGVSIRTVSRVLNKSPKVNRETRERIEQAIGLLNFKPSARARALAMGRSLLIGMVHSDRNALVLDSLQRGVARQANEAGYEVISHSVPIEQPGAIADILAFTRRSRVDGLVVLPPVSGIAGLAAALAADHIPAVALSAVPITGYGVVVLSAERQAAGDVARHLIALGHRRIALINGPQNTISAVERRNGFLDALAEAGLKVAAEVEGDYGLASGITAARDLLSRADRPTAIFATNDIMAAGVLKVTGERHIAVPEQLSVVGFDGSMISEMLTPALTTVTRPFGAMAEIAAGQLLRLIEHKPLIPFDTPVLQLAPGHSTAPPPA